VLDAERLALAAERHFRRFLTGPQFSSADQVGRVARAEVTDSGAVVLLLAVVLQRHCELAPITAKIAGMGFVATRSPKRWKQNWGGGVCGFLRLPHPYPLAASWGR
jgi:hypothetical protein